MKFKMEDGTCLRPFSTIEEHDEFICDNWLSVVRDQDIVYVLGDVAFSDFSALEKLNGRKRLVLGNHDNPKNQKLQKVFQKIMAWRIFPEYECVLTHVPIILTGKEKYTFNVHGHIHYRESPTPNHINVSAEAVNYTPVSLELLIETRKEMNNG